MIDLTSDKIPPKPNFDVSKGVQSFSTGVVGGGYFACLLVLYCLYSTTVLKNGGPQVFNALSWMPTPFSFSSVPRRYYDILFMLLLCFQLMVTWETIKSRPARCFILMILISSIVAGYIIAWRRIDLFFPDDLYSDGGWIWTQMEVLWLVSVIGLLLVWLVPLSYFLRSGCRPLVSRFGWAIKSACWRWLAGLFLCGGVLILAFGHPYYQSKFFEPWRILIGYFFSGYLIFGLPFILLTNLFRGHRFEDRSDLFFNIILIARGVWNAVFYRCRRSLTLALSSRRVKVSCRDLIVKLFFLPLLANFMLSEAAGLAQHLPIVLVQLGNGENISNQAVFDNAYWTIFHTIFCIDVGIGMLGYACSSRWLGNRSRSVEPTLLGWAVTLACYPPFNEISGIYLPFQSMSRGVIPYLQSDWIDMGLKTATILLWGIYVSATLAFGLRFSNLTHRGIITRGPYAFVRHPAYTAKSLAIWTSSLIMFNDPRQYLFLLAWNGVYYLRAVTEERHLSLDPDYLSYCERVKYRFIPGVI